MQEYTGGWDLRTNCWGPDWREIIPVAFFLLCAVAAGAVAYLIRRLAQRRQPKEQLSLKTPSSE